MTLKTNLTEKELMEDLLMSEKQIISSYTSGINYVTCPVLREVLSKCISTSQRCEYDILNSMGMRGWYEIQTASSRDLESVKTRFSKLLNKF